MALRIEKYGVYAVMGRPILYEGEMRRMITAQNIVTAFRERARSTSWEAWQKENPEMGNLLFKAQRLYDGG